MRGSAMAGLHEHWRRGGGGPAAAGARMRSLVPGPRLARNVCGKNYIHNIVVVMYSALQSRSDSLAQRTWQGQGQRLLGEALGEAEQVNGQNSIVGCASMELQRACRTLASNVDINGQASWAAPP